MRDSEHLNSSAGIGHWRAQQAVPMGLDDGTEPVLLDRAPRGLAG